MAFSNRKVGEKNEYYNWMVKVTADTDKKVLLTNDNLASKNSPASLIHTPSDDDESQFSNINDIADVADVLAYDKQAQVKIEKEAKKEAAEAAEAAQQEVAKKEAAKAQMEREAEIAVFRNNPKSAQQKAIELFPDVGVAGSALNKEFLARAERYQSEKKEFFAQPDWPVRLAKECSEALATKSVPK